MSEPTNLIVLPRVSDRVLWQAARKWTAKKQPKCLQAVAEELARRKRAA